MSKAIKDSFCELGKGACLATGAVAYNGSRNKVHERAADGSWRITKAGEGYFRHNWTEYQVHVPYIKLIKGRLARPVAGVAAEWYLQC